MTLNPSKPASRSDFRIALVCALRVESDPVEKIFDEVWEGRKSYGKAIEDSNSYTTGRIGIHNVVLTFPSSMGKSASASAATSLRSSFPGIKLCLLVGICGGAPISAEGKEIFLGDVAISTGIVPYDFGRQYPGKFERKDTLEDAPGRPSQELRCFLQKLGGQRIHRQLKKNTSSYSRDISQEGIDPAEYPGVGQDILYPSTYRHKHQDGSCSICSGFQGEGSDDCKEANRSTCHELGCAEVEQVFRRRTAQRRATTPTNDNTVAYEPDIHFGRIASGDSVMKSGTRRDEIVAKEKVIAFEMEGAGIWDNLPTIIIKSICDYADSHKNKNWQVYSAVVAAACTKAVLEQYEPIEGNTTSSPPGQNAFWNVPLPRNSRFVGRTGELAKLEKDLFGKTGAAKVAVSGLGGVGKTQIALELAYRFREQDPDCSVIWISATSTETVEQTYKDVLRQLKVPGSADEHTDKKLLLQQYLSQDRAGPWLLVFDNADDISMWLSKDGDPPSLQSYLPSNENGHILFTTRDRKTAVVLAESNVMTVVEMNEDAGIELLRTRLIKADLLNNRQDSLKLLSALTYLPLAVVQAAAYINANGISISRYIKLLEEQEEGAVALLSENFEEGRKPVTMTWLISFEQIQTRNPLASEYLSFMGCLEPKAVPLSLLPAASEKDFTDAIGTLDAYSFVTKRDAESALDLHRLVHLAIRNWLHQNSTQSMWITKAIERLGEAIPSHLLPNDGYAGWRLYGAHARYALDSGGDKTVARAQLLHQVAFWLAYDGKRYEEAEKAIKEAIEVNNLVRGDKKRETLPSMDALGWLYIKQERLEEAEELLKELVSTRVLVLGEAATGTQMSKAKLAIVYYKQGRLNDAENLCKQALEIAKQASAEDDRYTTRLMRELATVYMLQGRYKDAEDLVQRILFMRRRTFGENHPFTLSYLDFQVELYYKQGRVKEAIALCTKLLDLKKEVIGATSPKTLRTMHYLASQLNHVGRTDEAIALMEECARISEREFGLDHPETAEAFKRLAEWRLKEPRSATPNEVHVPGMGPLQLSEPSEEVIATVQAIGKRPSKFSGLSRLVLPLRLRAARKQ